MMMNIKFRAVMISRTRAVVCEWVAVNRTAKVM